MGWLSYIDIGDGKYIAVGALADIPASLPPGCIFIDNANNDQWKSVAGLPVKTTGVQVGGIGPTQQSYATGSFTIPDGKYVILAGDLILTGTDEVIMQGNSILRMI